jgi:hypothetical protein
LSDEQKAANTALSQVRIFIVSNWEGQNPICARISYSLVVPP